MGCIGCGTEFNNYTVGCTSCNERHANRRRRGQSNAMSDTEFDDKAYQGRQISVLAAKQWRDENPEEFAIRVSKGREHGLD